MSKAKREYSMKKKKYRVRMLQRGRKSKSNCERDREKREAKICKKPDRENNKKQT